MSFENPTKNVSGPENNAGNEQPAPENTNERSLVDRVREKINSYMEEDHLPTKEKLGYESTVGVYGGKLSEDEQKKMVWDVRGVWSRIDRRGDRFLRTVDEHHVKEPGKMFLKHPTKALGTLPFVADAKRFRGTPEQVLENVHRLGLDDYYGAHPWGVEIKKPEIYKEGIALQDIFRSDQIKSDLLDKFDRTEALGLATDYIKDLHEKHGGTGQLVSGAVIFRKGEGDRLENPVLNLPDIVYNPDKKIGDKEKLATDMLDFLVSIGVEEYRRSKDWGSVTKALNTILTHYDNKNIISLVKSFAKRGRLTLPGDLNVSQSLSSTAQSARKYFSAHNVQRLKVTEDMSTQLRDEVISVCDAFLK